MLNFLINNRRWLGVGLLLTFASSFGQTWFISLFADFIKAEYGLTDGSWGSIYTVATLCSAALMFWQGAIVDRVAMERLAPVLALLFACAAIGMASGSGLWILGLSVFLLRFCGQGMFGHIALTAMGRWFEAQRGRAVSITLLGHPAGEFIIPLIIALVIGSQSWRSLWYAVAAILCLVAPLLYMMLREDRDPKNRQRQVLSIPGMAGRHWRRQDALKHWLLPALVPVILTPGFISTVMFFHQAHIADVKGWTLPMMAPGYTASATAVVISSFAAGLALDRFGVTRVLPLLLLPMGIGIALIGPAEHVSLWYLALACLGITQGAANALWGVLYPVLYGTDHLGAIRSLATTLMVFSTAIGPGLTGLLIDAGIDFPTQSLFMGAWCLVMVGLCSVIAKRIKPALNHETLSAR